MPSESPAAIGSRSSVVVMSLARGAIDALRVTTSPVRVGSGPRRSVTRRVDGDTLSPARICQRVITPVNGAVVSRPGITGDDSVVGVHANTMFWGSGSELPIVTSARAAGTSTRNAATTTTTLLIGRH